MDKIGHADSPYERVARSNATFQNLTCGLIVAKFQEPENCRYCEDVCWPGVFITNRGDRGFWRNQKVGDINSRHIMENRYQIETKNIISF